MMVRIIFGIFKIFTKLYIRLFFGSIWSLKDKLNKEYTELDHKFYEHYFRKFNSWIGYNSIFETEPFLPHGPCGIFISGGAKIGRNAVIFQQVTIGSNTLKKSKNFGSPTIGDNVFIGSGAKIIGNIHIGDNCRIGANAVVYSDMPNNSVAIQSPTRIIEKKELLDNHFISVKDNQWCEYENGQWIPLKNFSITDS